MCVRWCTFSCDLWAKQWPHVSQPNGFSSVYVRNYKNVYKANKWDNVNNIYMSTKMLKKMTVERSFANRALKWFHSTMITAEEINISIKRYKMLTRKFKKSTEITNWDVYAIHHCEQTPCHRPDTGNFVHQYGVSSASEIKLCIINCAHLIWFFFSLKPWG